MSRQDDPSERGDPALQQGRSRPKDQDLLRRRDWQFAKGLFYLARICEAVWENVREGLMTMRSLRFGPPSHAQRA